MRSPPTSNPQRGHIPISRVAHDILTVKNSLLGRGGWSVYVCLEPAGDRRANGSPHGSRSVSAPFMKDLPLIPPPPWNVSFWDLRSALREHSRLITLDDDSVHIPRVA